MTDIDRKDTESTFRCRKCRIRLFSSHHLQLHASEDQELSKMGFGKQMHASSYDKCSSWFLRDENMLSWIIASVEEAQWTEGKIYCPKCKGRVGAFDFIHGVQCNCGRFVIPAIWIQKSRVDHILPKSQLTNLSIRKPVSTGLPVLNKRSSTSNVVHSEMSFSHGNVPWSCDICLNHTEDKDNKQGIVHDNGLPAVLRCSSCQNLCGESSWCSCVQLKHCLKNRYWSEPQTGAELENQDFQRLCGKNSGFCTCSSHDAYVMASNQSSSETSHVKWRWNGENLSTYRSTKSTEDQALGLHAEVRTESQTSHRAADTNISSGLSVEEGVQEIVAVEHKGVIPEIPDHHCCAVCLDLLFEPFKCCCGHVFCGPCLRQLNFRTGRKGTIRCPLCRKTVEHVSPASELRNEIRSTYDLHILRKRERAERRAPYRKWPLPTGRAPSHRTVSRTQRNVTLPCIICTFALCACLFSLVVIVVLSSLTDSIKIY